MLQFVNKVMICLIMRNKINITIPNAPTSGLQHAITQNKHRRWEKTLTDISSLSILAFFF